VAVSGNYAYVASKVADTLVVVDVTDKTNPLLLSVLSGTKLNGASGVVVSGNYAYVAVADYYALVVIDVTNPASPSFLSNVNSTLLNGAKGVAVSGNYAYVASQVANTLVVVDVGPPTVAPTESPTESPTEADSPWWTSLWFICPMAIICGCLFTLVVVGALIYSGCIHSGSSAPRPSAPTDCPIEITTKKAGEEPNADKEQPQVEVEVEGQF